MMDSIDAELNQLQNRLSELNQEQKFIQERIVQLQAERQRMASIAKPVLKPASFIYSPQEKIAIFKRLFKGREDVYPRRFETHISHIF